jgi:hypothetical protein
VYYRQIPPARRRYILGLLRLAAEGTQEEQGQAVLLARLIAMTPARKIPAKRRPR